jgi:hypothetical protein
MSEVTASGGAGSPVIAKLTAFAASHSVGAVRDVATEALAAIRAAEADAAARERERIAVYVETLFPRIDGPGWLAQDQRQAIAEHIAAAIRARGTAP